MGQRSLVDYGIQNDESDYRAHVGFRVGAVYFFPTENGRIAIESGQYREATATVPGAGNVVTGKGYIVPWDDIKGCEEIDIPIDILQKAGCKKRETTYQKGNKAIEVVKEMLFRGLIPISLTAQEIKDKKLQIRGEDIIITTKASIQVKCDFDAGSRERGGTGNLFLQIGEIHLRGIQHEQQYLPTIL